jgi:hypothetical protein
VRINLDSIQDAAFQTAVKLRLAACGAA